MAEASCQDVPMRVAYGEGFRRQQEGGVGVPHAALHMWRNCPLFGRVVLAGFDEDADIRSPLGHHVGLGKRL